MRVDLTVLERGREAEIRITRIDKGHCEDDDVDTLQVEGMYKNQLPSV